MATPDRIRKLQLRPPMSPMPWCFPVRKTIPQAITRTTAVRIAVARLELIPSIPSLARMEVSAANSADSSANPAHIHPHPVTGSVR